MSADASPLNPQPDVPGEMRRLAETLIGRIETRPDTTARRRGVKRDARAVFKAAAPVVDDYVVRMRALDNDTTEVNFRHDGELGDRQAAMAMRRIEGHVTALLIRRSKVLGWRTDRRGGEGRDILVAMLDHLLGEIRAWLESVLEVLDKPLPSPLRQAMAHGSEDLRSFVLAYFEKPPQIDELDAWTNRYRLEPSDGAAKRARPPRPTAPLRLRDDSAHNASSSASFRR
ncbi:MAG: hypothetical protein OXG82_13215 [Gammaproteobacteria bacterium]|nr:hypothetical protein [Gammaproteobacteria bacterium]